MASKKILRLRVELLNIEPTIWRSLEVQESCTFWDLHIALQGAFGWNDSHLHEFRACDSPHEAVRYGIPLDDEGAFKVLPGWDFRVSDVITTKEPCIEYAYDFGDGWLHRIILEEVNPELQGVSYPRCIDGERATPPDDCGGAEGYKHLLEVLSNRAHPDHSEMREWARSQLGLRSDFNPDEFVASGVRFADPKERLKMLLK
jgi:hypothetical protein